MTLFPLKTLEEFRYFSSLDSEDLTGSSRQDFDAENRLGFGAIIILNMVMVT